MEKTLITLRIDVDYPYPSRIRSFLRIALDIRVNKEYLRNSKIVARMINESPQEVKAYWFFTPKTVPDKELLGLMNNKKHEIALHIVNDPYNELKNLEKSTGKKIKYYTIHGTARLLARLMWKRWKSWTPEIPKDFRLQSFHQFPTPVGLDSLCFTMSPEQVLKVAEDYIRKGYVIYFHPIWLYQRGKMNHRGPFYTVLRSILKVG
ncbi:hypothetical protein MUP01_08765 [Candidatus Bathyarchaeota archaeon]|nr:hypothetical protein [Candidatus Bathyarchaeota archaeon]